MTRAEALRSPSFWLLLAAFTLVGFGIMGFQANWLPYLLESGFSAARASAGILFYGVVSGASRPIWGLLGERVPARYLMAGSTAFTGLSILAFLQIGTLLELIAYMSIAGVAMGGYLILQSLLTANYFGRAHLGAVTSMMRPVLMLSSALSPLVIGALYDARGNYTLAFVVAGAAWFSAGVIALLAKPPRSRAEQPLAV
jgi:MFS family permease